VYVEYESELVEQLTVNLKAVRYHQQNFICRLFKFKIEAEVSPVRLTGHMKKLIEDDYTLQFEFEAFLTRYRICVEILFRVIGLQAQGMKPKPNGSFDIKVSIKDPPIFLHAFEHVRGTTPECNNYEPHR